MAGDGELPSEKPLVLIHRPRFYPLPFADRLSQRFSLLDPHLSHSSSPAVSAADLLRLLGPRAAGIRAVLCLSLSPLDAEILACLPSLECVVASASGVDNIDLAECRRRRISVANNGGAFSEDVADYAIGLLIDILRRLSAGDRFVRAKSWPELRDFPLGFKLGGKRVGIVGLGSIGSLVAKRVAAFGCKVAYNSRTKKPFVSYPWYDNVHDLALDSNVLILLFVDGPNSAHCEH